MYSLFHSLFHHRDTLLHYTRYVIAGMLLGGLYSCDTLVYDYLRGCPPDKADDLHFVYTADATADVLPRYIQEVSLYCYDAQGKMVWSKHMDKQALSNKKGTTVDLPDGAYTMVAWGNSMENTKAVNSENLSNAYITAPPILTQQAVLTNDSLYFATKKITYSRTKNEQDTLIFRSAHVKIRLQLKNPDKTEGFMINYPGQPAFRINHLPKSVNFAGNPSPEQTSYLPIIKRNTTGDYEAVFNVLRFEDKNPITIDLLDMAAGNHVITTLSLQDFMAKHKIKVSGINEVTIAIKFSYSGTTITVDPWNAINVNPGFDR